MTRDYTDFFDFHSAPPELAATTRGDFAGGLSELLFSMGVPVVQIGAVVPPLWAAMSDGARHYHSPVHILAMFGYARRVGWELTESERLAVWFHDCVYKPTMRPGSNESQSSDFMRDLLNVTPVKRKIVQEAAKTIRWTAHHLEDEVPVEHHRVMDLDIASFTAPPEVFARQSAALRLEYNHLNDAEYNKATVSFLIALLERRALYRTPAFAPFEDVARQQIENEIGRLSDALYLRGGILAP